jgi:hypothetical protein
VFVEVAGGADGAVGAVWVTGVAGGGVVVVAGGVGVAAGTTEPDTVTTRETVPLFPAASVAVYVMV